jgi:formylglycine-generating enzyme required for sulfatase activity
MSRQTTNGIRQAGGFAQLAMICGLLLAGASGAVADDHAEARFRGTGKADPVRIDNVRRSDGPVAGQSSVTFDLGWDHSWRAAWAVTSAQHGGKDTLKLENWDAAWVFVKFRKPGAGGYSQATLSMNEADHRLPAGAALDVGLTDDGQRGLGVFVYRATAGSGANDFKGVTLRWLHGADGVENPGAVELKVLAIQMVLVPQCAFWVGDGSTDHVAGQFSAGDTTNPLRIESEDAITLGGQREENLNNRDATGMKSFDDFNCDQTRPLPAAFPKGYVSFYCMKYEITQQQYVDFLNTASHKQQAACTEEKPSAAAGTLVSPTLNGSRGGNAIKIAVPATVQSTVRKVSRGDAVIATVSARVGDAAVYETDAPHAACNFVGWRDGAAYAAWAGLRPMTELEFEKACRGPLKPLPNEYAWGSDRIADSETDGSAPRERSGASYWGIMNLSGGLMDRAVTVSYAAGRAFTGTHGDGGDWPWKTVGLGFRGGSSADTQSIWGGHGALRVSNRYAMAITGMHRDYRHPAMGFRCVRTANTKEKP